MTIQSKLKQFLSDIKTAEGQAKDKVEMGDPSPKNYLDLHYYSGIHNGFNFVMYIMEHPHLTIDEMNLMFNEMMQLDRLREN